MQRSSTLILAAIAGGAGIAPAFGQAFNIDINPTGAAHGAGTPANSYGAFPGQVGFWNNVNNPIGSSYTLKNLGGVNTAVTLQTAGTGGDYSANESFASGSYELLMEDGHRVESDDADTLTYTFNNLAAGPYFIYTYGDDPASSSKTSRVTVQGTSINVGGTHGTNAFTNTVTHCQHYAVVEAGQPLVVTIGNNTSVAFARGVVMGIQVVPLPTRLYVDASAPAGGDGTTWATAFNDLQAALAEAVAAAPAVEEIWVADGTYEPDTGINRAAAFHLRSGVALIGGFAGGETDVNDRDVFNQRAFLSGNINTAGNTDNSYHIVRASSTDETAVLDGFWLTSGYANGIHPEDGGSAIFMSDGSPTIRNCWFSGGYAAGGGGHVLVKGNSAPTFLNCTFINGDTDLDGGAFRSMSNAGWAPNFSQCRFLNCQAGSDGGAIVVESGAIRVMNSEFTGCDAGQSGGAIMSILSGQVNVLNCSLAGNTAGQFGGAITTASGTTANIYNSILWDNTAAMLAGNVQSQLYQAAGSTINLRYSCAQFYNGALFNNPGNTGANPQFVNPTGGDVYGNLNDDLSLQPTSPMIDAGSNGLIPLDFADADEDGVFLESAPYDVVFSARRVNNIHVADTGVGPAPVVDIGAFEFAATCPGDLDGDGDIDLDDLLIVLGDFGCTGDCDGDGDGSGATDLDDLLYVLGNFGTICD